MIKSSLGNCKKKLLEKSKIDESNLLEVEQSVSALGVDGWTPGNGANRCVAKNSSTFLKQQNTFQELNSFLLFPFDFDILWIVFEFVRFLCQPLQHSLCLCGKFHSTALLLQCIVVLKANKSNEIIMDLILSARKKRLIGHRRESILWQLFYEIVCSVEKVNTFSLHALAADDLLFTCR